MEAVFENESGSISLIPDHVGWPAQSAYRCHVALIPEDDGQVSAIVVNLPGAGSCGISEEEALKNVEEAICGMIESYQMAGEAIPWQDSDLTDVPAGARLMWILVDLQ